MQETLYSHVDQWRTENGKGQSPLPHNLKESTLILIFQEPTLTII